jgi:hypothetical protein
MLDGFVLPRVRLFHLDLVEERADLPSPGVTQTVESPEPAEKGQRFGAVSVAINQSA